MRRIKFCSILLALLVLSSSLFCSCSEDDGSGYIFRYNIVGNPQNLDPQLAVDDNSMLVLENLMQGLMKTTNNGQLEKSMAENYSVSADGLVYTFTLKQDVYWYSTEMFSKEDEYKANVTADDFVFAFRRIFDSQSHSPYKETFSCIKNAERIINKDKNPMEIISTSELGVKANGKYELEITLEYPCAAFLSLMATTAAMPCNQYFFESTQGKYGLDAASTPSNGDFYLKEWNYDPYWNNNYIIMRRNIPNNEINKVYPYSINFFIKKDGTELESEYLAESSDCIFTDGSNAALMGEGSTVSSFETISCGLVFNRNSAYFSNEKLRLALGYAIDRSRYSDITGSNQRSAMAVVPHDVTVLNKSYREMVSEQDKSLYSSISAMRYWHEGTAEQNVTSVDGLRILVPSSSPNTEILRKVTSQWQSELGISCEVQVVSQTEYDKKILDGDYDILYMEFSGSNSTPLSLFEKFYGKEAWQTSDEEYLALLSDINSAGTLIDTAKSCDNCEKYLIGHGVYIPLLYKNIYFTVTDKATDIQADPFTGKINFGRAKYFE